MKRLRACWRGLWLVGITLGLYLAWLVGHLMLSLAPTRRIAWRRWIFRSWSRAACWGLAVHVTVVGEPPRAGAFLVSNHLSYLDIPVLATQLHTVFVSKAEVAGWPLIGPGARAMGTIFLVRERKRDLPDVNRQIATALLRGDGVVVFPEGTSTKGDQVLPFRPSLLAPAAEGAHEVHPALLSYATAPGDPPASLSVCWWGDMPFAPHVAVLLGLERIDARIEFLPERCSDEDRKQLAEKLWAAVNSRFRPIP
ncbi:MAG: 1-acyl-sn-glycerol-3-phosphate acyltransferase [Planctomycetes bacterium]|nr:1-acyl-sn-glycerol-3-phosphate acyltransferase [Planctomycetota bacterium]